ncbi:trypsin-like peptidase domain-containing protein [Oculatella sp. LEGE 06141]|uniref:HhoA/HhoB/HtrA family serine endopeptidase n=1 Tax=Oculatella sp. LEGE 06141 TaxID=1828648 RepID=UPI001881B1CA|nr:HhoA/HhoB/HtrA family serine endopeptidase [Oculatella sp. LEGE 06141]MBE9179169.1 trypsin-like peptidase domain-containing protein [Oculatella sp. LEGE 06141]
MNKAQWHWHPIPFLLSVLLSVGLWVCYTPPIALAAPLNWGDRSQPMQLAQADPGSNFVTAAVEAAGPAVVQVNVSKTLSTDVPDFLRPFLGGVQPTPSTGRVVQGIGSGFVIDADGRVLTNAHVVAEADTVSVSFPDGRILEGEVLGTDRVTDVAVIQVRGDNLPHVTIGDSDRVTRGQWAIAIGNPLGLQETVTVGVISATERNSTAIGIPDKRIGFIQTDAAINPGNSGGPLLNQAGEVIGMNTAIIGGTQGLGFAIPINAAKRIAEQLIATGSVEHPYIGIQMVPLTASIKQQINAASNVQVDAEQGILVLQVARNSPAAKAGLREGDVIQAVNGRTVTDANLLQRLVEENGLNKKLELNVLRRQRTLNLAVQPDQLPAQVQ